MARTRAAARLAPRVPGGDQCDYRDDDDDDDDDGDDGDGGNDDEDEASKMIDTRTNGLFRTSHGDDYKTI